VQLYRYFVSQLVSFASITLCVASQRVFIVIVVCLFRYRLSTETFGCILVNVTELEGEMLDCFFGGGEDEIRVGQSF
jgi:hypothetical protein